MQINNGMIELYWDDLSQETQKELLTIWGDNGNYDVFPIITMPVGDPDADI